MDDRTRELRAASWYARNGQPGRAADIYRLLGQTRCLAALLAERGDEVLAADRLREAGRLLDEDRYGDALAKSESAVDLAEAMGDVAVIRAALEHSGRALLRLGRLDRAVERLERAVALGRNGSALCALGDMHRIRGQVGCAEAAYREALRVEPDSEPARAGLAQLLAGSDPLSALRFATHASPLVRGLVALAAGQRDRAAELARQAVEHATRHHNRAGLAEALELAAVAGQPSARRALTEALAIWRSLGARLDVLRLTVRLGELPGSTVAQRVDARLARENLTAQGVPGPAVESDVEPVVIRTLGRFEVTVGGRPVAATAWQSRKARDLLRILIVRRGRGIAREELAAILWSDDDSGKVGHRLSVALSTVRSVLDPDKRAPADYYIQATQTSVALDPARVSVDLDLLAEAEHGLRRQDRHVLDHVECGYTGDLFEDEPYDDWAGPLREQVRATYLRVLRALAELHRRDGDTDATVRCLHRLLAKDPYDEQAHLDLIDTLTTAGRHGEAHRARTRYTTAMRDVA